MDEEFERFESEHKYQPIYVCKCLKDADEQEETIEIPPRKQRILSTVTRTEHYLKERRIPELIRFLLTKLISLAPGKPIQYLEKLLDDCMLFRAGHGIAPVLYESQHLEAIVKSFDPGQRGWLSAGQVRRAFITIGLTPIEQLNDKISTEGVLNLLRKCQEAELLSLLSAGTDAGQSSSTKSTSLADDISFII